MDKISIKSKIKMFTIVSAHLCLVGWIVYCCRGPIVDSLNIIGEHVAKVWEHCSSFFVNVWRKIPASQQLVDGFIDILKPFR